MDLLTWISLRYKFPYMYWPAIKHTCAHACTLKRQHILILMHSKRCVFSYPSSLTNFAYNITHLTCVQEELDLSESQLNLCLSSLYIFLFYWFLPIKSRDTTINSATTATTLSHHPVILPLSVVQSVQLTKHH
jgi:hypothetical protein